MRKRIGVLILALVLVLLLLSTFTYRQLNSTLQASLIDVGQGDSICPGNSDGTELLIDQTTPRRVS